MGEPLDQSLALAAPGHKSVAVSGKVRSHKLHDDKPTITNEQVEEYFTKENERLRKRLKDANAQLEAQRKQLAIVDARREELETGVYLELLAVKAKLAAEEHANQRLKSLATANAQTIGNLAEELANAREGRDQLEARNQQITELRDALNELQGKHNFLQGQSDKIVAASVAAVEKRLGDELGRTQAALEHALAAQNASGETLRVVAANLKSVLSSQQRPQHPTEAQQLQDEAAVLPETTLALVEEVQLVFITRRQFDENLIEELRADLDATRAQLDNERRMNNYTTEELRVLRGVTTELKSTIAQLDNEHRMNNDTARENRQLRKDLEQKETRAADVAQQHEAALANMTRERDTARSEVESLARELEAQRAASDKRVLQLNDATVAWVNEAQRVREELAQKQEQKLAALRQQVVQAHDTANAWLREVARLREENAHKEQAAEQTRAEHERQYQQLAAALAEERVHRDRERAESNVLRGELATAVTDAEARASMERKAQRAEVDELAAALAEERAHRDRERTEYNTLRGQLATAVSDLQSASMEREAQRAEVDELAAALAEERAHRDREHTEYNALRGQLATAVTDLQSAEARTSMEREARRAEVDVLAAAVAEERAHRDRERTECNALRGQLATAVTDLQSAEARTSMEREARRVEVDKLVQTAEQARAEHEVQLAVYQQQTAALAEERDREVAALRRELAIAASVLRSAEEQASMNYEALRVVVNELEQTLARVAAEHAANLAEHERRLEAHRDQIRTLFRQLKQEERTVAELRQTDRAAKTARAAQLGNVEIHVPR